MTTSVLAQLLRPGDQVLIGQATGEPTALVQALFELAPRISGLEAFADSRSIPRGRRTCPRP